VPKSSVLTTFQDVPVDYWAWRFIEALAAGGHRHALPGRPPRLLGGPLDRAAGARGSRRRLLHLAAALLPGQ
jgi:hypothetical protein